MAKQPPLRFKAQKVVFPQATHRRRKITSSEVDRKENLSGQIGGKVGKPKKPKSGGGW